MLRVLVVESSESERDALCDALATADPLICLAGACGTCADVERWRAAQTEPPALVFTTRMLPDGSPLSAWVGVEDVAVILLLEANDDSIAFLRLHRVPYVLKPVGPLALTAVIERFRLAGPAFAGRFAEYVADTKPRFAAKKPAKAARPAGKGNARKRSGKPKR